MPKITLDEFCSHWVSRTSTRVMASRLEFNVFDFATAAGDYTRQQFLSPFGGTRRPFATVESPRSE